MRVSDAARRPAGLNPVGGSLPVSAAPMAAAPMQAAPVAEIPTVAQAQPEIAGETGSGS
jgi:hypothetical protein